MEDRINFIYVKARTFHVVVAPPCGTFLKRKENIMKF